MKKMTIPALILALSLIIPSAALAAAPAQVERTNIDGVAYVVKTFEVSPDTDPAGLTDPAFVENGWLFTHETTTSEERYVDATKAVTQPVTAESETKDLSTVLKKFPSTIPYDEDGYAGTLILDAGSVTTEVAGYTTKTSTISTTKTFPGLMYQDPSAIPQSAVKDGATLPLVDVNWAVTGTSLAGDSLMPTEYTATATYAKKVSSQIPTGYISTATYSGEVSRRELTGVVYTLTYIGELLPPPEPDEQLTVDSEQITVGNTGWWMWLGFLLALGGGVFAALYVLSRQGVRVYNLVEDDYLCIGRQRIDPRRPVVDLNAFGDVVQSRFFAFVLDKATTRKLFGRNVSVTLGDISVKHLVKDMSGPYRFNLEIGGTLDA